MELTTIERITLLQLLPKEGDILTLRVIRDVRDRLAFTEEEHTRLKFQRDDQSIKWDIEADTPVDIEIGDVAKKIIADRFKELNEERKLTEEHIDLFDKFV